MNIPHPSRAPSRAPSSDPSRSPSSAPSRSHIVLLGLPGSGKSRAGILVAEGVGRPFVDSDLTVERHLGDPASARDDEHRSDDAGDAEMEALMEAFESVIDGAQPVVFAASAGVLPRLEPRHLDGAFTVWLEASPRVLAERVEDDAPRPELGDDPLAELTRRAEEHGPRARGLADLVVEVDDRPVEEVATVITDAWRSKRRASPDEPSPPVPRSPAAGEDR